MANKNCLHCKIADLINAHFRELQKLPADAMPLVPDHAVIEPIAQLMGDVLSHSENSAERFAMLARFIRTAEGTRRAIVEHKNAQDGGRAGASLQ